MNSLEAMIGVTAFLAGIGLLLGAVAEQGSAAENAGISLGAKGAALLCASAADSAHSNSAEILGGEECYIEEGFAVFEAGAKEKRVPLLSVKDNNTGVAGHYLKWDDIFN